MSVMSCWVREWRFVTSSRSTSASAAPRPPKATAPMRRKIHPSVHVLFPFRILFPRFRRGFRVAPSQSACLASPSDYRNRPHGSLCSFFSLSVCPRINLEMVDERTPSQGHGPTLRQFIAPCASLSVSPGLGRRVIHSGVRCSTSQGRSTPRDMAGGWARAMGQVVDGRPLCSPSRWHIWSSS